MHELSIRDVKVVLVAGVLCPAALAASFGLGYACGYERSEIKNQPAPVTSGSGPVPGLAIDAGADAIRDAGQRR